MDNNTEEEKLVIEFTVLNSVQEMDEHIRAVLKCAEAIWGGKQQTTPTTEQLDLIRKQAGEIKMLNEINLSLAKNYTGATK